MILAALIAKGGQAYLEEQAEKNPVAFMTLLGKILPLQINGENGGPIMVRWLSDRDIEATPPQPMLLSRPQRVA